MNKTILSITLVMLFAIFQSCQKESYDSSNEISADIELEQIETRASKSNKGDPSINTCNKLYIYTDPVTVTIAKYQSIIDQLEYPGISIRNCDESFYSFNNSNPGSTYAVNLENSIDIINMDLPNNAITFRIKNCQILCYGCLFNNFCYAEGLRIVKGTGANSCNLANLELDFSEHQYVKLSLSSYINNVTCNVTVCDDPCCDE